MGMIQRVLFLASSFFLTASFLAEDMERGALERLEAPTQLCVFYILQNAAPEFEKDHNTINNKRQTGKPIEYSMGLFQQL